MANIDWPFTGEYFDSMFLSNNTKGVFYQAAAPTYWSIVGSVGDRLLSISDPSGSGGYNAWNPGSLAGTRYTVDHNHSTGSWILTEAQMPAHTHTVTRGTGGDGTYDVYWMNTNYGHIIMLDDVVTQSTGGGQSHNHGYLTDESALDMDSTWYPKVIVCIICNKDG